MVFHNVSFSFIHCHPVYSRLVLLPSAVSVSNQLSLWSAGGTLGLDVPVRNIPTWQISQRVGWCMCVGDLPEGSYFLHFFRPQAISQYQAIYQAISSNAVQCNFSGLCKSHYSSEISCAFPWSCWLLGSHWPSACPISTGWTLWATLRTNRSKRSGPCWRRWF